MTNYNQKLFENAQFAEASYAKFIDENHDGAIDSTEMIKALRGAKLDGFSETQAAEFAAKYRVISHIPNTASGFSATVFEEIAAQSDGTHKQIVSIRGTENRTDWTQGNIAGIGQQGFALRQAIDLYNYIEECKLPENASGNYNALSLSDNIVEKSNYLIGGAGNYADRLNALINQGYWVEGNNVYELIKTTRQGIGKGLTHYDIVGHSLGEYLAANAEFLRSVA